MNNEHVCFIIETMRRQRWSPLSVSGEFIRNVTMNTNRRHSFPTRQDNVSRYKTYLFLKIRTIDVVFYLLAQQMGIRKFIVKRNVRNTDLQESN